MKVLQRSFSLDSTPMDIVLLVWIQSLFLIAYITEGESAPDLLEMQFAVQNAPPTDTSTSGGSECWTSVVCKNTKRRPVCGTDGVTYTSKCALKRVRKCENRDVDVKSTGRCTSTVRDGLDPSQCLEERRDALFSTRGESKHRSPGVYVPECRQDGTFSPVQCHQEAGFCWCVTPDGRPLPGTSVKGTDVKCLDNGLGYQRDSSDTSGPNIKRRRGLKEKSCTTIDRQKFNSNLISTFAEEYHREHVLDSTEDSKTRESKIVNWKFDQLDEDDDGVMLRRQVRTFKKMLKKLVKPRRCAKTFDSYCDLDQDRRLNQHEWLGCLGVDIRDSLNSGKGGSKMCTPPERDEFNNNLIRAFLNEYNERQTEAPNRDRRATQTKSQSEELLDTPERRAIAWKFSDLDTDGDGRLRRKEIRPLKALVKGSIKPKSCAKTLNTHCDGNDDQFIDPSEWTVCLGVDINNGEENLHDNNDGSKKTRPGDNKAGTEVDRNSSWFDVIKRLKTTPQTEGSQKSTSAVNEGSQDSREESSILEGGCLKARTHFLELHRSDPDDHIFVPECLPDGYYRKEQCHNATKFCWCVDQDTGKPIPATSTQNVMPNCTNVKTREFKGCTYPKRKLFLTLLLDQLTTEMIEFAQNTSEKSPLLESNPDMSLEESAVRWKVKMMDKNGDEKLDRKELKDFRMNIRMKKDLRKCSRNFLRYCDQGDREITLDEWIECTGINEQQRNLPEQSDGKGINPFIAYLKGGQ